ncbi:superoxide dismutase [Ni] [Haloferula sp.]|uniref:superoxide dismutase [Ni] n=1 Tax=Haloferula sp. TaxID=2497595 RepID=UPI00329D0EB4
MKSFFCTTILAAALLGSLTSDVSAHCQVPCGIFDNNNVIESMHTDWVTIDKAAKQIDELGEDPKANAHQLIRWVSNKESHAQDIQEKVLNYFLAQRLKTDDPEYVEKLKLCHAVIITAMKCKQSTDGAMVKKLHDLLQDFEKAFAVKE